MICGSCLCGGVKLEIHGKLTRASHCHCSMCRKAHGAAFGSYTATTPSDFRVTSGAELIARYRSPADVVRTFCARGRRATK